MKQPLSFSTTSLPKPELSWVHALIGFVISLIGTLLITIITSLVVTGGSEQDMQKAIIQLSSNLLPLQFLSMFVLGVVVLRVMRGRHYKNSDLGLVQPVKTDYLYAFGAAVLFVIISQVASRLSPELGEAGRKVAQQVSMGEDVTRDLIIVFSATVAAPLGEELVYRGLIFRGLSDAMRNVKDATARPFAFVLPALISAVLFAMSHGGEGQDKQVVYLTIFGIMMAWLYWKTGSFYVPVVAHSITNVINFLLFASATGGKVSPIVYALMFVAPFVSFGVVWVVQRLLVRNNQS